MSTSYCDYPAGSNTGTTCAAPDATPTTANCDAAVGDLTHVGSYTGSASRYGTFDQAGNVQEWNEAIISVSGRGVRGGSFVSAAFFLGLAASERLPPPRWPRTSASGFASRASPSPVRVTS